MRKFRHLRQIIMAISAMLGLILIFAILSITLVSQSQENYTLDFVMESYDAGQVRAIITSGTDLFVSSDGAYIYAESDGIYRVSDGEFLGAYPSSYFSPDGTHFAQRQVGVYRLEDMALSFETAHHVTFSADGDYFAVNTEGVYRLSDLTQVLQIPDAIFAFSDDSQLVATSQGRVYQLSNPDNFVEIPEIADGVVPSVSPDGRFAWARNASLVRVDSGRVVAPTLEGVHFTPNGQWAVVYGIGIFDLSSDAQTPAIDLDDIHTVSPLGGYFATPQGIFRLSDGEQIIDTQHLNLPEFTFAPDDTTVVIRGEGLYRLEPFELLHELQSFGNYHANGLYIATNDRIVRTSDGSIVFQAQNGRFPTTIMSRDGSLIALYGDGVYSIATGEKLFSVVGSMDAFSVDSTYLAVRGRYEIAIYRISDGRRYEGLEALYTEYGLLNVGQVVFVADSTDLQPQLPFIRVTSDQQFSTRPESGFETATFIPDGAYLTVLETVADWVRVRHGERDLWTQVSPDNILLLPN